MYPRANIGLPFGSASGLCAIDIDLQQDDPLYAAIMEKLPPSPWHRVGKKGVGLVYKWSGQKNFKLRDDDNNMIVEFLGLGNQMVLPPSIHPETGREYTSNTNLWEVIDQIVVLPEDIEIQLREFLIAKGFSVSRGTRSSPVDVVPAGNRHNMMTRHAGYLARVVLGIDKSNQFSLMEAIEQMEHWVTTYTAQVGGDSMDPAEGIGMLLEFLIKDLEKGKTLPEGWDAGLNDYWLQHDSIKNIRERNQTARWTVGKAKEWLRNRVADKPDDEDWLLGSVQNVIQQVAKDDQFTEMDFRALVPHIRSLMGKDGLGKADLVQAFKTAKRGGDDGEEWEDQEVIARTCLEQMQRFGEIRYDHETFWQWNGSCFEELKEHTIYMYVAINVKGSKLAVRHSDYASIIKVLSRMCAQKLVKAEENGINFANGWVGEDLIVRNHAPKYGATFTLPFDYKPELATKCSRFFEFLHDCWGNEADFLDRVKALQEFFAASLFGIAPQFQKALLLFGRAGTGKTVLLNIFRSLLPPDGVADLGPQHWGERFGPTALVGKVINICGELPESGVISGQLFKTIVEGSEITTEYKNRDLFVFKPRCAHVFASNFMPASRDTSNGFTRRWLILDFSNVVPPEKQIKTLAEDILADEREAIAAWACEGLPRLLKQGDYTQPESHVRRLEQMRRMNNSVKAFFESQVDLVFGENERIMAQDLYDRYQFYMRNLASRMTPVHFERFITMLEDLGLDVEMEKDGMGNKEWVIQGISVRQA
jgi:P4 family phage/plasmid primase-like protien